ncbi:MAG: UTP--glucose-1-phosphate uridylyltransferase GalU [Candidatus Methylomirabilales bacterium]
MKAVIPAAGLGTRFLPLTKEQPKEMLPVVDRPAIHWVVEEAVDSGATDILIITGREKRAIEDYFDSSYKLAHYFIRNNDPERLKALEDISNMADIHFIRQREPRGLGDAILRARKHVGDEPFLVILGDTINVAVPPVAKQLIDAHGSLDYTVVAIEKVRPEKISSYGIVAGKMVDDQLMRIEDLVEKPAPEEAPSDWGISGTYVFTPRIFDALERTPPGLKGEVQLTDALRLLKEEEPVYGYVFQGRRYDIGTKLDWFKAHLELTLMREEFRGPLVRFMKEWLNGA